MYHLEEAVRNQMNFSPKQLKVFRWWSSEQTGEYDGIICDGAVRSGKTMCMSFSFVLWSLAEFDGENFAVCGKTIASVKRNILSTLTKLSQTIGFKVTEKVSKNYIEISMANRKNRYYIFGGRDESSASLIQGMTLAGVLLDEVALMPRSFVEQAAARCSVTGSKLWFNCNPESASHWFKREWIDRAEEKRLLHLHFTLEDNPALSKSIKERYRRLYSGAFYERFILGKWVNTTGLIYPMFSREAHVVGILPELFERCMVSCDYGTVNPSSFGLWGLSGDTWYRISEYYYDSRREGMQKTDEEHYKGLERLCGGRNIEKVICDPSAASFIACIRRHGKYNVVCAKNDVISGIRKTADMLNSGHLKIGLGCKDCIREFGLYRWDDSSAADKPLKENDHAMDDVRYFVSEIKKDNSGFFVMAIER